jgi:protein-S-isoprenylcysteine O-methyltransferase Ste14
MAIETKTRKESKGQVWFYLQLPLWALYFLAPHWGTSYAWDPGLRTFGLVLVGWGAFFVLGSIVTLGRVQGWHNLTAFPRPLRGLPLVTNGAYAYVRHPLALGLLLCGAGWGLYREDYSKLLTALVFVVFLLFALANEEAALQRTYPSYKDYAKRVKRLIPGCF